MTYNSKYRTPNFMVLQTAVFVTSLEIIPDCT